jgi:hypothetical protein
MTEWFCNRCGSVFHSKSHPSCCGQPAEEFDFQKAKQSLVSGSNSWRDIFIVYKNRWQYHQLAREETNRLHQDGCANAATHIIHFVDRLIKELEEAGEDEG